MSSPLLRRSASVLLTGLRAAAESVPTRRFMLVLFSYSDKKYTAGAACAAAFIPPK